MTDGDAERRRLRARRASRSLRTGLTLGNEAELRRCLEDLGVSGICNIYGGTETYGNCCVTPTEWPAERRLDQPGPAAARRAVAHRRSGDRRAARARARWARSQVTRLPRARLSRRRRRARAPRSATDGWFRTGDLGLPRRGRRPALQLPRNRDDQDRRDQRGTTRGRGVPGHAPGGAQHARSWACPTSGSSEVVVAFVVPRDGADGHRGRAADLLLRAHRRLQGARAHPPGARSCPPPTPASWRGAALVELDHAATGSVA